MATGWQGGPGRGAANGKGRTDAREQAGTHELGVGGPGVSIKEVCKGEQLRGRIPRVAGSHRRILDTGVTGSDVCEEEGSE